MGQPVLAKSITDLFETLMAIHLLNHRSKSLRCFQVFVEQRRLTGRSYDDRVRVEYQIDVAARRGHIVYIQAK
jgi:hypothetical protein